MGGKRFRILCLAIVSVCIASGIAWSAGNPAGAGTAASVVTAAEKEGKLII